jgi:formylglycine-generating enzyme required for sulfatase activity
MGTDAGLPPEAPAHRVNLAPFSLDRHEVTVARFAAFVAATGYSTEAERAGWSGVFDPARGEWRAVRGAAWDRPEGPGSAPDPEEPVTQVSWNDAAAFCRFAGGRLPTEAEFEYAARGGLAGRRFAWGDELQPGGVYLANWWQGEFPRLDRGEDGFSGRAPVGRYPPNPYGLFDLVGNVWEWCSDWFDPDYYAASPERQPRGPRDGVRRVIRGGSWLCSAEACSGVRVAARSSATPASGLNNLGFRCAGD